MENDNLLSMPIRQMTGEEFLSLLEKHFDHGAQNTGTVIVQEQHLKYAYGIRGIANLLNCSIATANRIIKSGVINDAIIQNGRTIIVDTEKALELMKNSNT